MINTISLWILPVIIIFILTFGLIRKVPLYEEFVDGAKDGFKVAVDIIPYLVAIIVGVSMLRASGIVESITGVLSPIFDRFMIPTETLPIMIVRSFSGSAVLGLFSELANTFNPDSYLVKLAAVIVGSSETTFFVLSVYFGSVGIKKFRFAMLVGLLADFISIVVAIMVCSYFFHPNIG